ncbi:MAG TPA: DUF2249 domain-containing protein [Ramlibacter sp.]|nr:DUF2249 domain-containing protein [Ramlibacter sp.]
MTQAAPRIDVRTIAPRDRHPLIFSTFNSLAAGQAMELVNDHDPRPLYYQFNAQMPGQFSWEYLEHGPEVFRVAITRTQDAPAADSAGSCCGGGCGG